MTYVYLLISEFHPKQRYIGITDDLKQRIHDHNAGRSPHTSKYIPWKLATYLAFSQKQTAISFEPYLKSGSGNSLQTKAFGRCKRANLRAN